MAALAANGFLVAILAFAPSAAQAQSPHAESVVVLEKGIYQAVTIEKGAVPGTTGAVDTVRGSRLVASTTRIPGLNGIRFGLRYVIVGAGDGEPEIRLVTRYPRAGLLDPETGVRHFENAYVIRSTIGQTAYREYHLDHDWAIVPGLWTFEFWFGDRKIGEQSFCVEPASKEGTPASPESAETCFLLLG